MTPLVEELPAGAGSGAVLSSGWPGCRTDCSSTAPRPAPRLGRYSFVTADPVAVVRSQATADEHVDLQTGRATAPSRGDALAAVRGARSRRIAPIRSPGCRRFRAAPPATSPTTGG